MANIFSVQMFRIFTEYFIATHLFLFQQQPETKIIYSRVVADHRQPSRFCLQQSHDQILRNAT